MDIEEIMAENLKMIGAVAQPPAADTIEEDIR